MKIQKNNIKKGVESEMWQRCLTIQPKIRVADPSLTRPADCRTDVQSMEPNNN
jgi:hypothetical protein